MIISILQSAPLLMQGAAKTTQLFLGSVLISLCVGTIWGLFRSNQLRTKWLGVTLDSITFVLRGIPFYVQLLLTYFVLPDLLGINVSATTASIGALGFCSTAYVSQIVRGGINVIPQGQWEAAGVLGYSRANTIRFIILPQTLRNVLPSLNGEFDQLLKSTSVISAIGVLELTGAARNIIAREMNPLSMYLAIAIMYLMMSSMLNLFANTLERRFTS